MDMVDIRQLETSLMLIFDRLYEDGSVTAAARRLNMSQPSVSFGLAKLRVLLDDDLFIRTGRGMRPTPLADAIAPAVRRVLETIDREILRKPAFVPAETERVFVISTSDIGVLVFVPPLLKMLGDRAPRARLRCITLPHAELRRALAEGEVDLALGYFPDLQEEGIRAEDLFEHPFTCIARRDHPVINGSLTLDQFLACDHLVVSQEGRSQELFERRMSELKLNRRVLLQLSHFMNVPQLIVTSDMISTVPRAVGICSWEASGLQMLDPPMDIPLIPLKQHWHTRRDSDLALSWFRSLVTAQFLNWDPSVARVSPIWKG